MNQALTLNLELRISEAPIVASSLQSAMSVELLGEIACVFITADGVEHPFVPRELGLFSTALADASADESVLASLTLNALRGHSPGCARTAIHLPVLGSHDNLFGKVSDSKLLLLLYFLLCVVSCVEQSVYWCVVSCVYWCAYCLRCSCFVAKWVDALPSIRNHMIVYCRVTATCAEGASVPSLPRRERPWP